MVYNLEKTTEFDKFIKRIQGLVAKNGIVELTEKKEKNKKLRELHLVMAAIGETYGLTDDEAKQYCKNTFGLKYEKNNKTFLKSTGDYTDEELIGLISILISSFASLGVVFPS